MMLKRIIVGVLLISVLGAGGAALANQAAQPKSASTTPDPTAVPAVPVAVNEQAGVPNVNAEENTGEPWQAEGIIIALDDFGLSFVTNNGEELYVELGPPDYWQAQATQLQSGLQATITGTQSGGIYHAYQLMLADGQTLQLRTELGQPLWSGGVDNAQGQNGNQADGDRVPEPQAQVDEWITISGTLVAFQGGNMTMSTADGELINFQTGQPRFFADQGVSFQVGEEIVVVGYYQVEKFMAGDITQVSTGLRVMLRDPNGRPLWAGPGNGNGRANGQGN